MYHYNFTNDLRISSLAETLESAAIAFLTDSVPSASEDKSTNNNYNTVGFYFNLKAKGNCARLASNGKVKKLVLNFVKKFQFPNPRTQSDFENAKADHILLAPMRDIVKLLHILSLLNIDKAYLTKEEIVHFVFFNDELAKRENYNLLNTANQLIAYRNDGVLPPNINTSESEHEWKQFDRQIREMIKTLNYTGCVIENGDQILLNSSNISRDNEADLFEILNCNSYWEGSSIEEYQDYMDDIEMDDAIDYSDEKNVVLQNKNGEKMYNRILFGAPGTGKSFQLNLGAAPYYEAEKNAVQKDDSEKIRKIIQDANDFSKCVAIGLKYNDVIKNQKPKQLHDAYGCSLDAGYALCQGAKIENIRKNIADVDDDKLDVSVINEELAKFSKDKQASWAALGFKYSSYFFGKTTGDIQDDLGLSKTSSAASWILYGVNAAKYIDTLEEDEEKPKYVERVTFHPNYSYAQFVGTYKPIQDEDDSKNIVYSYVPGPFMRTYVRAKRAEQNKTDEKFLIIIEEINRANVAAVFGDVFQLLDRRSSGEHKGESEYPIAASEDIKRYLKDNGIADCNELKIPSNMYIWATMNSADQGVFPMDTAFKRRWEFEYIGVNDKKEEIEEFEIPMQEKKDDVGNLVKDAEGNVTHEWMKWNELRTKINNKLTDCGKNEDKLLGPFFISMEKLESVNGHNEKEAANFVKSFKSKVLMYLFEDVCKMRPGDLFNCEKMRYSEICKKFDSDGIGVFNF